jgi:hypothetical protein
MAERAAHLVDHVLPDVPIRQWVLTLPPRLRYVLAWRHELCRAVVRLLHPAIERHLRGWARDSGLPRARGGGVAVIQRFGGSANLNVHVHALVLDGVFVRTSAGRLAFHMAPALSTIDVREILATIVAGVQRLMAREGLDDEGADPAAEVAGFLAGWAAASVQQLVPDAGGMRRPGRVGRAAAPTTAAPSVACHAQWDGHDLHAGVRVPAGHRDRLERVCRYALRPALAEERLSRTPEGDVAVQLRRPWADGTTALVFTPNAFLARVAVLVPRPRVNLPLYLGVLAPRAAWRSEVVPQRVPPATEPVTLSPASPGPCHRGWRWADLMRRVFAVDVLACPTCGGRLRLIATLEASEATRRVLRHLGLPTEVPPPVPARAPPSLDDWAA